MIDPVRFYLTELDGWEELLRFYLHQSFRYTWLFTTFRYTWLFTTFFVKNNDSPDSQDFSQKLTGILCKHLKSIVSVFILQLFNTVFNFNNQTKFVRLQMFVSEICQITDVCQSVLHMKGHFRNRIYVACAKYIF